MSETGTVSYLIERKIIFTPATQYLARVDQPEQQIKLKQTASLCLLLLIENQGKVVSQNELLEFGWGENHRQASFNAFYQSILSLRKSFLQLELDPSFITTIKRKGLIINEEIRIEEIETPQILASVAEESCVLNADLTEFSDETPHKPLITKTETMLIALTIIICGLILYPRTASDDYFSGYITAQNNPTNCQYYFNHDASNFTRHTSFIDRNPGLCQSNKYIYITTYHESKKLSVILCRSPMQREQKNTCQSIYYPRYDS